jgi:hypothetical protein
MQVKRLLFLLTVTLKLFTFPALSQETTRVDICVYGGTSAGVIAAYTAKQLGKSVILVEPGTRLGGLSSGGLGFTDIGNKYAISGLALDFYRRIGRHYGKFEQWIFEPKVAESIFKEYIRRGNVPVKYATRILDVKKENGWIRQIVTESSLDDKAGKTSNVIEAAMFIDCSYEGDLMAKAGVSYKVGREANSTYQETYNGVQLRDKHQFPDGIDPYKEKGKPESGLLWGISNSPLAPQGSGDDKVQAYNFRICLTSDSANRIEISRPENYDSSQYELLLRLLEKEPNRPFNLILKPDRMPNQKLDINNNGPFSTDMIGMNYNYPEGSYAARAAIQKIHEDYNKGLLYFIGHDARVPAHLRNEMLKWGYPKDEYEAYGHWSPQMYIREARRMIGDYVMTQANCQGKVTVSDGVGMAAYTMDSHNCQRIVIEKDGVKMVKNEGDVQVGGFPPYPVSYRSLIPRVEQCKNLFVPVCLSASHIAYGSIRMEPVFMVLAQSSATAAVMAIDAKSSVQQVDINRLQRLLNSNPLADGSVPDILIDNENKNVKLNGKWNKELNKGGSYGPSWYADSSKGAGNKSVRFTADIKQSGTYKVYSYYPRIQRGASVSTFMIHDGKSGKEVTIDNNAIRIEGQTSGEWVSLGAYQLVAGKKVYVDISNKGADGIIIADAVLFVKSSG